MEREFRPKRIRIRNYKESIWVYKADVYGDLEEASQIANEYGYTLGIIKRNVGQKYWGYVCKTTLSKGLGQILNYDEQFICKAMIRSENEFIEKQLAYFLDELYIGGINELDGVIAETKLAYRVLSTINDMDALVMKDGSLTEIIPNAHFDIIRDEKEYKVVLIDNKDINKVNGW